MRSAPATSMPDTEREGLRLTRDDEGHAGDDPGIRRRLTQVLIPYHRFALPHADRPRSSRDGRPFDGRHADLPGHVRSSRPLLLHRRIQRTRADMIDRCSNQTLDLKTDFNGALADPAAFPEAVHLLWIGVGTEEPERMHDRTSRNCTTSLDEAQYQACLLRVAGNVARMADMAARSEGVCSEALPMILRTESFLI